MLLAAVSYRVVFVATVVILAGSSVIPTGSAEKLPGMLLDYRNSFLSYEQKGADTCPFTYFRETCSDFAHVVLVSTANTTCLGTFIREQFALVKASCLPPNAEPTSIRLQAKTPQPVTVAAVSIHPDFQRASSGGRSTMDLAVLKFNGSVSFNQNVAASCLWAADNLEMYSKIQEVFYDPTTNKMKQNSTICTGDSRNDCLKSAQRLWCQRKPANSLLQIRELGKYKMHPMLASFECDASGDIVSIVQFLPWIREVTKSTDIEFDLTNTGLGEKCTKGEPAVDGVCMQIESCPKVRKNFKKLQQSEKISTMCGFEGNDPLTCCATEDMLKGPEQLDAFSGIVEEVEHCEQLYDEFRRTPEEYQLNPQVAIIDLQDSINCSATLVTSRYLLTSAQCIANANLKNAIVWLGLTNDIDGVSQSNRVHSVYPHPKFNAKTNRNNVAVVKLASPALIQPYSVPACLWRSKSKMPTNLDSTGFDMADHAIAATSASPMYYSDCRRMYNSALNPAEMCVHHQPVKDCGPQDGRSSCGEPGSGLYSTLYVGEEMKPVTYLVGLYSYGFQCDKGGPAIYTRVSEYYAWIKSVIFLTAQELN